MFTSFLVNSPSEDPGVFLEMKYRHEGFLFDLGDIQRLSPRRIRKLKYVFVTHTHMDHFIGFDHMLRICLGRNQHISLFGPPGFLANVESKLGAYTWNLVENYANDFELAVTEIHEAFRMTRYYSCRSRFQPEDEERHETSDLKIVEEDTFVVNAVFLDHSIPCLAFNLEERTRLNIKKNILREMELPTGAWLTKFKEQIVSREPENTLVRIWWKNEENIVIEKFMPLGELREKAVKITPGQKICYITDAVWNEPNTSKMVELAKGAEVLFIEAPFLDKDAKTAAKKFHLTAHQAGTLASLAQVKRMIIFHFSPKYKGREEDLQKEAMTAFQKSSS